MSRVLVIDDSSEVNELVGETLKANGYQVFVAEDGLQGVQLAQQCSPDLILCDVNMPLLDGYATLTALRQHASTSTIPFVFLTGLADRLNVRQGMELGADDYLTKPFTNSELLAAVKARLEKQSALTRQAERKLEELRGNISLALPHELLIPLTAISNFSNLLEEKYDRISAAELFDVASGLQEATRRLQRTVENFLLYSQIELVAAAPEKLAALAAGEFLIPKENLIEIATAIARRTGRQEDLVVEIESACLPIAPDKLQKAVAELLDNAFKFSRAGDSVSLASCVEEGRITISISDHGRGMTAEQIRRVGAHVQFERKFYEQEGSGLGLIIAKRLTQIHGGAFEIESVPDEETSIHLRFPLAGPPQASTFVL